MSSMDGSGLGANDWTEMELKKRVNRVIASDSALLQEASAVESGDSVPIAGWLRTGPDAEGTASGARRSRAGRVYAARSPV